jgi:phage gp36-like protein
MGAYIDWGDVAGRYPKIETRGGSSEIDPSFIEGAEAEINAYLASTYSLPFTAPIPPLIRDLAIDLTYCKMAVGKLEDREKICERVTSLLEKLRDGDITLTTSGAAVDQLNLSGLWSSESGYSPVFERDSQYNWGVDSAQLESIEDNRN